MWGRYDGRAGPLRHQPAYAQATAIGVAALALAAVLALLSATYGGEEAGVLAGFYASLARLAGIVFLAGVLLLAVGRSMKKHTTDTDLIVARSATGFSARPAVTPSILRTGSCYHWCSASEPGKAVTISRLLPIRG